MDASWYQAGRSDLTVNGVGWTIPIEVGLTFAHKLPDAFRNSPDVREIWVFPYDDEQPDTLSSRYIVVRRGIRWQHWEDHLLAEFRRLQEDHARVDPLRRFLDSSSDKR